MKIAINGNIIETEDIYKISKIISTKNGDIKHYFKISLWNKNDIICEKDTNCFNHYNHRIRIGISQYNDGNIKDIEKSLEYQNSLTKITIFREMLITVWSENQSTIPQFNLE